MPTTSAGRMAPRPLLFPLLLLLLAFLPGGAPDLTADAAALSAFRAAVGRSALPSWNSSNPTCSWQGVVCENGRVVELHLPGAGLAGQIPAGSLGGLSAIRTLSVRLNALTGVLPSDLSSLVELRNLYLQGNKFSGEIPPGIASLSNLVRLNLADNLFTGSIPAELSKLPRLATLFLNGNRLSGALPTLDLPNLAQFNVSYNQLNGSIPQKLRSMPATAFIKTGLCGRPLDLCPGEVEPSPASEGPSNSGVPVNGEIGRRKKHKLSAGAIAGIAIGVAVFVLALLILLVLLCRKSSESKTRSLEAAMVAGSKPSEAPLEQQRDKGFENGGGNGPAAAAAATAAAKENAAAAAAATASAKKLVFLGGGGVAAAFDLEDLLRASAEVLGKGTFGTAYKAVLESGTTVAVKRLKDVALTEKEFKEKIEPVGRLDHPNLVPLRAFYYSKDEKLLVYDYMPMGSLSALLHGNRGSGRTPLNWETRRNIALSAARGIEFIHSTGPSASHGNIKSSNVLLTKTYEARVSDHGLAVLAGAASNPTRVAGYRAPEVTDPRKISQKADVYSFGVLLLELLTGKAPAQALLNEEGIDLPRWVQSVVREEWTSEVFDLELLRYQNVEEEMVQLLQLAIDCTAQYPDKRPSISEVVRRIEDIRSSSLAEQGQQKSYTEDADGQSSKRTDSTDGAKTPAAESSLI